jgi:hypothetical protein
MVTFVCDHFSSLPPFNLHRQSLYTLLTTIDIILIAIISVSLCGRQALFIIISKSHRNAAARCYFSHFKDWSIS